MKMAVQIFLLVFALWCAHLAGIMYFKAKDDPSIRFAAVVRTALSIAAAVLVVVV
jgi:hypothetical protein